MPSINTFRNESCTWQVLPQGTLLMIDSEGTAAVMDTPYHIIGSALVFNDGGQTHIIQNGTETVL